MPQRKYMDLVATSNAMRRTAMVEIDERDLVPPWIRKKMPSPNMVSKMARELSNMALKDYINKGHSAGALLACASPGDHLRAGN